MLAAFNLKFAYGQNTNPNSPIAFGTSTMSNIWAGEFADISNHLAANYMNMQPVEQLLRFAAPRYGKKGVNNPNYVFLRNVNVLSLGNLIEGSYNSSMVVPPQTLSGLITSTHTLINLKLAEKFNYYLEIDMHPSGTCTPLNSSGVPTNGGIIDHSTPLINAANANRHLPLSAFTRIAGLNPADAATNAGISYCNPAPSPAPFPVANSYTNTTTVATAASIPAHETNATAPSFYLSSQSPINPTPQATARQTAKEMANNYYLYTTNPAISSIYQPAVYKNGVLIAPAIPSTPCTTADPCYYSEGRAGLD
jgi:hypothetical protein